MQRERLIKSGKLLEADFYPIWENGKRLPTRAPKSRRTSEEQQRYNRKMAVRNFVRRINANFDTGDIFLHVTFAPDNAPGSTDAADRAVYNYIRRIKTRRASELKSVRSRLSSDGSDAELKKKCSKLSEPFRYYVIMEEQEYKTGKLKGWVAQHYHIFMTGGLERDVIEDMWTHGARVNADRYQPERFGPETAAKYCAKDPRGKKRFRCSRNLKSPVVQKPKDGKISSRGVERLATERTDDREYWEKRYKGYRFVRCFSRYNPYNGYWYVSVVMYKTATESALPTWGNDTEDEILW